VNQVAEADQPTVIFLDVAAVAAAMEKRLQCFYSQTRYFEARIIFK